MAVSLRLSWQDCVSVSGSDGQAVVSGPEARIALRGLAPEISAALARLAPPGEFEECLEESVLEGGADALARWYFHVEQLRNLGLIRQTLHSDGTLLAELVPFGRRPGNLRGAARHGETGRARDRPAPSGNPHEMNGAGRNALVLSRFAYLRRHHRNFVLESPLAHARIVLHDGRAIALLGALATPATADDLARRFRDIEPDAVSRLIEFLDEAKMLDAVKVDESAAEDEPPGLKSWEFHDLLFHSRSRRGRTDGRFGGTYRLTHRPPPPAVKSTAAQESIELFRPDLERLQREDPPLAQVQERRHSLRAYGRDPMTAEQLGEFLFRVARVKRRWQGEASAPTGPVKMDFTERPYPGGGGLYELEYYPVVKACRGIASGLYHYDPEQHRLERVSAATREVALVWHEAGASAGIAPATLQVLVVLAARFERLAWKYESIAYSLILKNVGVVYQTMYLAATAMGLAPCALGCGDSDLFARAAGTDYYAESSVGEFLLGSK